MFMASEYQGDPLDTAPPEVLAAVGAGELSIDDAARCHGVVIVGSAVDVSATAVMRERIRDERKNWTRTPGAHDIRAALPRNSVHIDDHLVIAHGLDSAVYACDCGTVLAPADRDWKPQACHAELEAEDLGAKVRLHPGLRVDAYACPGCGALLAVDVRARDDEPLREFELAR